MHYVPDINTRPGCAPAGTGFRQRMSPRRRSTDLEHEVSGTLSRGNDSRMGGQDFCVPAIITKGGTSHERIRGRAERMPADACI